MGSYDKEVEFRIFKDVNEELKAFGGDKERSVTDLIQLKRDAADLIYNIKNNPETYGVEGPTKLKMYKKFWSAFDDAIRDTVSGDANAKSFIQANAELSDLLHVRNMTTGAANAALQMPGMPEIAAGMLGGNLMGQAINHPLAGMIAGGGVGAAKGSLGQFSQTIPNRLGGIQQKASTFLSSSPGIVNAIQNTPSAIMGAGRQVNYPGAMAPQVSREPQSVPTEMQAKAMQRGLVENLADYEIPRNSQQILANPQMALAKIAQQPNVDPQFIKGLQDALEKHPDKLKTTLPLMIMQFPNLFEADKYDRCDGKIGCSTPDPIMKQQLIQRAYKDVELRKDLSNTDKTMLWDGLNRDGSLPDTFR